MNNKQTMINFFKSLTLKAAENGVDLGGLKHEEVCLAQTWGSLCGFIFWGLSSELNQLVAGYFNDWIQHHDDNPGGYGAQRSYGTVQTMHYARYANGAQGWYRGACPHGGHLQCALFNADGPEQVEAREGVAVSTAYYPDFD